MDGDSDLDGMHPEAREALQRRERFMPDSMRDAGARRIRLLESVASRWQNWNPPAVGGVTDGTIPGPDGRIPVRAYRPDTEGPYPTVVFYHGGGFVIGSLDSHDLLCRHLARESGCVVLSVDYRLAPEHPFPAAVEDAYAALEWAADNTATLRGTGDLAVVGDSAGGALAAIVALIAAETDGPELDYQYLLYPGVGLEEDQDSVREHAGIVLSEDDLQWFRECYYDSPVDERNPYADPAKAGDRSGVAPATVLTAGFDPLRDGGRLYADQLEADGVPTRYVEYEDVMHGFATMLGTPELERAHDAVADVAADLREALAH
ncbi:alpha/beta hydrolase [Halobacterium jilantaiense]|uniref:Acetyl esterase n=1 Tax=Halobacterium jilantaiense TaxID=355548 RepID=A0A1I0PBQ4_9EURY|nr:alpha/beta hydrolase [Halobacterium jilantaiense]SEW11554.1 acetyl esterase [Halobacterium jilantaiense]